MSYYSQPGPFTTITDSAITADLLADLPTDIPGLVSCVQHNLLHIFWHEAYGVSLSDERKAEVQIRTVNEYLRCIYAHDPRPLTEPRDPDQRRIGNCRDFTLLLTALLRHQGIPARARCGFGTYFIPDHYEDHWVTEYWDGARWVMVDAQLDTLQRDKLNLDFDPLDMPHDRFISGGHGWQLCRQEGVDVFPWDQPRCR